MHRREAGRSSERRVPSAAHSSEAQRRHGAEFLSAVAPLISARCMVRLALLGNALLPAAALFVAACASAPGRARDVVVTAGEPIKVSLLQVQDGLRFELQNASAEDRAAVYSDASTNPLAKVVPDEQLQRLLDVFAQSGLFATAQSTAAPDARDVLRIDRAGSSWTWSRRQRGVQADEARFHEAKAYFLELYNSSTAYHRGQARPDFREERGRAREDAEAARRRLEGLRAKDGARGPGR